MKNKLLIIIYPILFSLLIGCDNGSGSDIKYVALGASDAVGVGATPLTNGYVYLIRDELERMGKETNLKNLGIPAAQIGSIRDNELPLADHENPDLITLFTGANDLVAGVSPERFEENLSSLLDDLQDETDAFIVIGTLPAIDLLPRFQNNPDPNVTVTRIHQFNEAIVRQAGTHKISIADLSSIEVDGDVTANDGYHPNDRGYEIIANHFLAIIKPHFINS